MTQLLLRSLNEVFFLFSFHSKHVAPDNRHTLLVWGRGITICSALPACKLQQQFSQGFASLSRLQSIMGTRVFRFQQVLHHERSTISFQAASVTVSTLEDATSNSMLRTEDQGSQKMVFHSSKELSSCHLVDISQYYRVVAR